MKKDGPIAVIGSAGQLGQDLMKILGDRAVAVDHDRADVRDADALGKAMQEIQPAWVINCASKTHVDNCEDEPEEAFAVNAVGALNVARAAVAVGARTCYVSTDYVFRGDKPVGESYTEEDVPDPINVYGASKLAGEILTRQADPDALIVRVSSLFGVAGARGKGGNFIETILRKARAGEALKVVADQWMSPTYTSDAAKAIEILLANGATGMSHIRNSGACSWYEFAVHALEAADIKAEVEPVAAATWNARATRPFNSSLSNLRYLQETTTIMRPWKAAVNAYMKAKADPETTPRPIK